KYHVMRTSMIFRRLDSAKCLLLALTMFAVAPAGGCATQGEKMVQSFARTRESVSEAQRQVDTTLVSLQALRTAPASALKDTFRRYKDEVAKLEQEGADARFRAKAMQEEADMHVKAWEKEMA